MFLSAVRRSFLSVARSNTKSGLLKCLKKDAIKTFSAAATKRSTSNPTKELIKTLEVELADQIETIKEEEMSPATVLEAFSDFVEQGGWKIEHPKDTLMVTLSRRDEKLQADVAVKFDLLQVYNELYNNSESELFDQEEEGGEVAERGYENENENSPIANSDEPIDEFDYTSLPLSIEIKRDSVQGKQLNFECILEGDEEQSELIIENVSVIRSDGNDNANANVYNAPNFSQLDESLQENFKEFLTSVLPGGQEELMAFMKEYAVAQEAGMYQNWLGEVRDILKQ